jgi:hypothetical protein
MKVVLQTAGAKRVERKLRGVANHAVDARPAWDAIAAGFMEDYARDIDGRGRRRWRPLSAKTLRNKRRRGLDPRPLHATERLSRSLTVRGADGQVLRTTRDQLELGTSVDYAPYVLGPRPVKLSGAVKTRSLRLLRTWILQPWEETA